MIHILLAAQGFEEQHIARINQVIDGWGALTAIDPQADAAHYAKALEQAEIVYGWPPVAALRNSAVRFVQLASIGYDGYVGKGLEQQPDLVICNASGTMDPGIAENVLAMLLAFTRHLPQHLRDQHERRWQKLPHYGELAGATACIIGLGGLGSAIAKRCAALEMAVIGVRRDPSKGHEIARQVYPMAQLRAAVAQADHVIAILPASDTTHHVIDKGVFAAMKPSAYFYNIGRGSTVEEQALIARLASGQLAGAGLDVFEAEPLADASPLWAMDNVIITPHIGGRSAREFDRLADLLCENLRSYHAGEPLRNQIVLGLEN